MTFSLLINNKERLCCYDFILIVVCYLYKMFTSDSYKYETNGTYLDYEFESVGRKGVIKKVARFSLISIKLYSFGFGDLDEATGKINDEVASRNGDRDKVLRTVAKIIFDFTGIYTDSSVFIQGSTPARTRIYQMGINKYWDDISLHFEVFGHTGQEWEPFEKGKNYEAFIGRRKAPFLFI